ncbi:hypothetical protein [Nitrosovibrio sp. Nv17]|jgi:hypothetical protein|uniref:hypothetical protein n=1 Tax=Nitrosovibrio sp. Nv17 TaxID=1855339 RepID=UPI000908678E|nr:hypothetical protein [Nitrosovibrio sp. Nv17]SFW34946.1 hypothetical protein SAMN05216414_12163 [Nitrosovibrio sp. Nv17]
MQYLLDPIRPNSCISAAIFCSAVLAFPLPAFAGDARTQALEQSLRQLEASLRAVREELDQIKAESARESRKLAEIQERSTRLERQQDTRQAAPAAAALPEQSGKRHMVFFRGGYSHNFDHRDGVSIHSDGAGGAGGRPDRDAWYIGAGFDWNLTNDAWGLAPGISVASELMFEYKEFASRTRGNALTPVGAGVNVSQFTLTAAPKIRFMEGSDFRPWIIPAGLGIHVISPPSESITVLIPGIMFGAGVDYRIWKDFFVGVDTRYHLSGRNDGVKVDGLTAGAYLGIGF